MSYQPAAIAEADPFARTHEQDVQQANFGRTLYRSALATGIGGVVAMGGAGAAEANGSDTNPQAISPNTSTKVQEGSVDRLDFATFAKKEASSTASKKQLPASKNPSKPTKANCRKAALKKPELEVTETKNPSFRAGEFVANAINKACGKFGKRGVLFGVDVSGKANDQGRVYRLNPRPLGPPIIKVGNGRIASRQTYKIRGCTNITERIDLKPKAITFFVPNGKQAPKNEEEIKKLGKANSKKFAGDTDVYCDTSKTGSAAESAAEEGAKQVSELRCDMKNQGPINALNDSTEKPARSKRGENVVSLSPKGLDALVTYGHDTSSRLSSRGCDPNDQRPVSPGEAGF